MKRPTAKQARAWALRVYRAALNAAEAGDWERAQELTDVGYRCAFCRRHVQECDLSPRCSECEAHRLCAMEFNGIAATVVAGYMMPHIGRARLRRAIAGLEALDV